MSLLNGPFTITEKTGPDTYKLSDESQETIVVHPDRLQLFTGSSDPINTPITTPSVTKNEFFPINEGQGPAEGPSPLPESIEIKSFLDPEEVLHEPDHHQRPRHTCPNTKTKAMAPSISHISVPPAKPVDPDTEKHHSYPTVISQTNTPIYPLLSLLFLGLLGVSAYVTIEPSILNPLQCPHHLTSYIFYVFDNLISQNKSISTQKEILNCTSNLQNYSWDTG